MKDYELESSLRLLELVYSKAVSNNQSTFTVSTVAFDGISDYKDHIYAFESNHGQSITHHQSGQDLIFQIHK